MLTLTHLSLSIPQSLNQQINTKSTNQRIQVQPRQDRGDRRHHGALRGQRGPSPEQAGEEIRACGKAQGGVQNWRIRSTISSR